ncbi:MAG: zinc/manganese transport system ATP-binding protein [Glaciecola sp.]|jgi:zinc/manganese transport system ATP-binding protein
MSSETQVRPPLGQQLPVATLRGTTMASDQGVLWRDLDMDIHHGEFLAVLGPNGAGKSTLLKVLLGLVPLSAGSVHIAGVPARRGSPDIGYIPQHTVRDPNLTLRGRDLVGLGLDGHRNGPGLRCRGWRRRKVAAALEQVGATGYASTPVGRLSGGELQRLRVAQALVGDPAVLLCDEPLLSLDLGHQRQVSELIDQRRRMAHTAVVFVTHEINPILEFVDRVLYLVDGKFRIGTPQEVMTSTVLSELYQTDVDVLEIRGRLVVVGGDDALANERGHHHHHPDDHPGGRR